MIEFPKMKYNAKSPSRVIHIYLAISTENIPLAMAAIVFSSPLVAYRSFNRLEVLSSAVLLRGISIEPFSDQILSVSFIGDEIS